MSAGHCCHVTDAEVGALHLHLVSLPGTFFYPVVVLSFFLISNSKILNPSRRNTLLNLTQTKENEMPANTSCRHQPEEMSTEVFLKAARLTRFQTTTATLLQTLPERPTLVYTSRKRRPVVTVYVRVTKTVHLETHDGFCSGADEPDTVRDFQQFQIIRVSHQTLEFDCNGTLTLPQFAKFNKSAACFPEAGSGFCGCKSTWTVVCAEIIPPPPKRKRRRQLIENDSVVYDDVDDEQDID